MFPKNIISKIFPALFIVIFLLTGVMPVKADSLTSPLSISYAFTVNSTLDLPDDLTQPGTCHTAANTCTLRAAIMQANRVGYVNSVTINVPSGHYVLTPPSSPADGDESGDLNLTTPTVYTTTYHIVGAGAATTIIDANSYGRVLRVHSGRSVVISGVTIQNGYLVTGINSGCGIYNEGFLNVNDMVITNNHCAGYGGGIYNLNQLAVSGSTINLNTSSLGGGGIGESGSYLSIMNSTISGNSSTGSNGGGILSGGAAIKISNSTISSNSAYGSGGGISNSSQNLIIVNSTLSGNLVNLNGGAINNKSTGQVNVYNSTIAFNGADWDADINGGEAGGIYNQIGGTFNLINSLVAGNSVSGAPIYDDCYGTLSSYGGNLIGTASESPSGASCTINFVGGSWVNLNNLNLLGPLQDNGGPTATIALLPGNNAIDQGNVVKGCVDETNTPLSSDQRGFARVAGVRCDIGAYEFNDYMPPIVSSIVRANPNPTNLANVNFTITFSESVTGVDPSDFTLTKTGVNGATVSGVSGSGSVYTVTVNTGSGSGTIRLNVPANAVVTDLAGNPINGLPFNTGETYTVDKSPITLPNGWVGGVSISSDKNIVAVGRPHIGSEISSYDGFSTAGAHTAYIPMLFRAAFGSTYNAAFYIQNVDAASANLTIKYYDSTGTLTCSTPDTITSLASKGYWLPSTCVPNGWVGGVVVTSDKNIVAIGRPHIGAEVMTYNSFSSGSLASYIPMLFKGAFGGTYNSAFYVQNVDPTNTANLTIKYYNSAGTLSCTVNDTLASFASKGYWVPGETCLPTDWVGGAVVTSNRSIVTVGRPHVGSQITTYNGFSAGSVSSYVPMLFKNAFGGTYNAAFYVQNLGASTTTLTIKYYDLAGNLTCAATDTVVPMASKGYWMPSTCVPTGWVGGAVITSAQPIVAVGRPHIGQQVTTYDGFTSGSLNSYLPMLFKDAFGGSYDSAFYVQNTEANTATVITKFYDNAGVLTCTRNDALPAFSTLSLWVPSLTCVP